MLLDWSSSHQQWHVRGRGQDEEGEEEIGVEGEEEEEGTGRLRAYPNSKTWDSRVLKETIEVVVEVVAEGEEVMVEEGEKVVATQDKEEEEGAGVKEWMEEEERVEGEAEEGVGVIVGDDVVGSN